MVRNALSLVTKFSVISLRQKQSSANGLDTYEEAVALSTLQSLEIERDLDLALRKAAALHAGSLIFFLLFLIRYEILCLTRLRKWGYRQAQTTIRERDPVFSTQISRWSLASCTEWPAGDHTSLTSCLGHIDENTVLKYSQDANLDINEQVRLATKLKKTG
jgi:hypothetical protein